jgi:lipopolysaccharide/colanic/teichoic acid biosynthesis glycosyltransferase
MALVALIVLSPLLVMTALAIKILMPGPVLFKHQRIGRFAQPFTIYKFRSMQLNNSTVSVTLSTDQRITPFGHFLRRSKLDELPQLLNILKGDVVGPRSDVPGYYDTLVGDDQVIWQLRPGLTGLDRMCYPDEQAILDKESDPERFYDEKLWPDKVRLNYLYARHHNSCLDALIILNTASVLLFGKQLKEIQVNGVKVKGTFEMDDSG